MPDTHHLPLPEDPLTMDRINVRARIAEPDMSAMFHKFDASRFSWLAVQLRSAGLDEIARLADDWASEHLETAEKLEAAP